MDWFTLEEMRCHDKAKTPYPEAWRKDRWPRLLSVMNPIRERWANPVGVLSGYRTAEHNGKNPGAAKLSQHVQGRAADLRPAGLPADIADWTQAHYEVINAFHEMILDMYRSGNLPNLGGLGKYPTFVHVDTRQGDHLAQWNE